MDHLRRCHRAVPSGEPSLSKEVTSFLEIKQVTRFRVHKMHIVIQDYFPPPMVWWCVILLEMVITSSSAMIHYFPVLINIKMMSHLKRRAHFWLSLSFLVHVVQMYVKPHPQLMRLCRSVFLVFLENFTILILLFLVFLSGIFWFHFWEVGRHGDKLQPNSNHFSFPYTQSDLCITQCHHPTQPHSLITTLSFLQNCLFAWFVVIFIFCSGNHDPFLTSASCSWSHTARCVTSSLFKLQLLPLQFKQTE